MAIYSSPRSTPMRPIQERLLLLALLPPSPLLLLHLPGQAEDVLHLLRHVFQLLQRHRQAHGLRRLLWAHL